MFGVQRGSYRTIADVVKALGGDRIVLEMFIQDFVLTPLPWLSAIPSALHIIIGDDRRFNLPGQLLTAQFEHDALDGDVALPC